MIRKTKSGQMGSKTRRSNADKICGYEEKEIRVKISRDRVSIALYYISLISGLEI